MIWTITQWKECELDEYSDALLCLLPLPLRVWMVWMGSANEEWIISLLWAKFDRIVQFTYEIFSSWSPFSKLDYTQNSLKNHKLGSWFVAGFSGAPRNLLVEGGRGLIYTGLILDTRPVCRKRITSQVFWPKFQFSAHFASNTLCKCILTICTTIPQCARTRGKKNDSNRIIPHRASLGQSRR